MWLTCWANVDDWSWFNGTCERWLNVVSMMSMHENWNATCLPPGPQIALNLCSNEIHFRRHSICGHRWRRRSTNRLKQRANGHTYINYDVMLDKIEWRECSTAVDLSSTHTLSLTSPWILNDLNVFCFWFFFLTVSIQFILCFDYHTLSGYSKIIIRPVWGNSIYMACSCFWTYMHASVLYALESINYLFKSELFILCFGST